MIPRAFALAFSIKTGSGLNDKRSQSITSESRCKIPFGSGSITSTCAFGKSTLSICVFCADDNESLFFTIIIFTVSLTSFSQIDSTKYRIYEFINSIDHFETKGSTYLEENASPFRLLNRNDSLDFDYKNCMFIIDEYLSDTLFWKKNFNQEDKEYMIDQIRQLMQFKWEKGKIIKDIKLISKKDARKYSRKVLKYWNKDSKTNDFTFKFLIEYSAPIFNKKHTLALVYSSTYSGPLSASWGIDVYFLIDGKWICIGHDLKGMS